MIMSERDARGPLEHEKNALELLRSKRIALPRVAAVQPDAEPARALRAAAMGEAVGHDPALRLLLQPVVADRRRGRQRLIDVPVVDQLAAALLAAAVGPHTGKAIGLQLDAHPGRAGGAVAQARAQLDTRAGGAQ